MEIGELDSSLKKDVSRIKGLLTAGYDKVRRPYAKEESNYMRRTVFAATVNESNFLVDMTGNSRWWTIEVKSINFNHGIDMQQVFAQLAIDIENGEQWWLTAEEELLLDQQNEDYLPVSVVRDRLDSYLDGVKLENNNPQMRHMTATEILDLLEFKNPGNSLAREIKPLLEARLGRRKKVNGKDGWSFPDNLGQSQGHGLELGRRSTPSPTPGSTAPDF